MAGPLLVPVPRRVTPLPGRWAAPRGLAEALEGWSLAQQVPEGIRARVDPGAADARESYLLTIGEQGPDLLAADRAGLFYGMMTLRQLLRQAGPENAPPAARGAGPTGRAARRGAPARVPCLRIEDGPAYPVRGVMLDISRDRVPTMETLRRLVDLWAELKFNQVQLYMEHTFAYPSHPRVWADASPLTPQEVEELDRYCAARAMELVPNQNSFGHMERWLRHPSYRGLAECPWGFTDPWGVFREEPSTLNPLDPGSVELLNGMFGELLPHFSSRRVNVGGDEPWELGQGRSRQACLERGRGRVYLSFLLRIKGLVEKRGRAMQYCGDIIVNHPELIRELPRDAVALDWGYEADHPFERECGLFAAAGIPFYVCPGTSSWNSLAGRWANARENIRRAALEGRRAGAAGMLLTDWGDNGHWQQLPAAVPGYLYGAAAGWAPEAADRFDPAEGLSRHFFRDPTGHAARALLGMAGLYEDSVARLHNAGVLAVLLLPSLQPYYRGELERYRGYGFRREMERLEEARRLAGQARIGAGDGAQLEAELAFTADLLAHAARLGRERFAAGGFSTAEAPAAGRRRLAGELAELEERYRALWLARSRPGGLRESAGRLARLRETYGG